jgi:hypothetical protein
MSRGRRRSDTSKRVCGAICAGLGAALWAWTANETYCGRLPLKLGVLITLAFLVHGVGSVYLASFQPREPRWPPRG